MSTSPLSPAPISQDLQESVSFANTTIEECSGSKAYSSPPRTPTSIYCIAHQRLDDVDGLTREWMSEHQHLVQENAPLGSLKGHFLAPSFTSEINREHQLSDQQLDDIAQVFAERCALDAYSKGPEDSPDITPEFYAFMIKREFKSLIERSHVQKGWQFQMTIMPNFFSAFCQAFPDLESITITGCANLTEKQLSDLASLKKLKKLDATSTSIFNGQEFPQLPALESLTLDHAFLSKEFFEWLANCSFLKTLSLSHIQNPELLVNLKHPGLETVNLAGNNLTTRDLAKITAKLPKSVTIQY